MYDCNKCKHTGDCGIQRVIRVLIDIVEYSDKGHATYPETRAQRGLEMLSENCEGFSKTCPRS